LAANAGWLPGILGVFERSKAGRFEPGNVIITDSIQGLQTAASILAEHREVARPFPGPSKPLCRPAQSCAVGDGWSLIMLNDRENILSALREKPLKVYEIMKRANVVNEEACQSLLLKMRGEGLVKFDIHKGRWLIG
jgi:hypothetical protein